MSPSRSLLGDACRFSSMDRDGLSIRAFGTSPARTPMRTTYWRRLMILRMRNVAVMLGLLVLGSLALPLVGCGTNSDDQGGAGRRLDSGSPQGGSNAPTGTGGMTGGQGGSGTGGTVQTGFACSGGGGESGTGTTVRVPATCLPYAQGQYYDCPAGTCGCYYNRVTGCLCADDTVSPCKPLDSTCTAATAGGTGALGTADPKTNVSCYCDRYGYWWCD
jgi:hypothetical protein